MRCNRSSKDTVIEFVFFIWHCRDKSMTRFKCVIGIFILISGSCSFGDINIDNLLLPERLRNVIFNRTQKYWGCYISKIAEIVTRKIPLFLKSKIQNEYNVVNIVQYLYDETTFFRKRALQTEIVPNGKFIIDKFTTVNVTKALGNLRKHHGFVSIVDNSTQYYKDYNELENSDYVNNLFTWSFSAAAVFGLKYNFRQIYFSTYISTQCQLGQLNLRSYLLNEEKTFVYCGQYSDMINYANSPKVDVSILAKKLTFYDISFSFMVVDLGLGFSSNFWNSSEKDTPLWSILFPISEVMLYRFHVNSLKFNKIFLQFMYGSKNNIIIHDGPGFKSEILKSFLNNKSGPSELLFFTSTFQCMIHFILETYLNSSVTFLRYRNIQQDNITKLFLDFGETKSISFPYSILNKSYRIEIFEISVPRGFHVNVSFLHFKYHGYGISSCRYAALTTYNWIHKTYKEILTVCEPHYSIYKNRKIYSETSKMILVFYHFYQYSTIEVEILLSVTRCAPIPFELLSYNQRYAS